MVNDQLENGARFLEILAANGYDIRVAFWVKEADDERWFLYVGSPLVDEKGPASAYDFAIQIMRGHPDLRIDLFDVKMVGMKDSMAAAVQNVTKPKVVDAQFAIPSAKPYAGPTWYRGPALGGVSIDGAYIYPPAPSGAPV